MDLSTLSTMAGLISLGVTLLVAGVGGYYLTRSGVSQKITEAQESAMRALQTEMTVQRNRIDDIEKENTRLEKTNSRLERIIDNICVALKTKGIIISISGDMINIDVEDSKKSTVIRIHDDGREG